MKIKPTDKVVVKVQAESYTEGGVSTKNYKGSWEKVLNTISDNHSYFWQVGEDEDGEVLSCEDVLNSIIESNGDGCDFIIKMVVEKDKKKWTVIDEDFEEEDIDCDWTFRYTICMIEDILFVSILTLLIPTLLICWWDSKN